MSETIILTGGGTAGHVTVNINLEKELKKHFNNIVYIGSKTGIEKELIRKNTQYEYEAISTVKFVRKNLFKNICLPFKLLKAIREAKKLLKKYKPSVIFSKGGYVGLPVVIAGKKLGIPVICHESDITMGLANRLAKKYASVICTNFEKTAIENGKKCIYTGMPLKFSKLTQSQAKQKLGITSTKPVILVTGGSLGAKALNEFIWSNIDELTKHYFVYHLVGKNNINKNIKNTDYKQVDFTNDMWTIFKASDYAISRAGANTIIELLSNEILTIFVPLPKGVSRGDQVENALYLENKGVCKTILQDDLTLEKMQKTLIYLKNNIVKIKNEMKKQNFTDGTDRIMKIILDTKKTSNS